MTVRALSASARPYAASVLSYEELTPAERQLWDAFPEGREVDLRGGEERTVRAAVVVALLLGQNAEPSGAVPALRLTGARITGRIVLDGAEIRHLFRLRECVLEEDISLEAASTLAVGIVDSRLPGFRAPSARIGGRLTLRGSVVEGSADRFAVQLIHAHVSGELLLNGATLSAPGGVALSGGGMVLDGALYGEHGFRAQGAVQLPGAQLNGGLFLRGARLENPGGVALSGDNMTVTTVRLSRGFTADGKVRLRGAQVADLLSFEGAELAGEGTSLVCVGMRTSDLDLRFAAAPGGRVDLRNARAAGVVDDPRTWPPVLRLDGFVYDSVRFDDEDAMPGGVAPAQRLLWFRRDHDYRPQPYEQLASYYRRIGHDDHARRVLLHKQRHRRRTATSAVGRVWGGLLDVTVGYGYRPWLAGVWLAALTTLGTLVFRALTPTPVKPGEGPPFNAFVYSLDLLIPVGGLGQRGAWHWDGGDAQWLAYAFVAIGWVLTTAVLAGVTRALSKN
ncbi:oxidoreductase [Streptomyces albidochromogenes]